MNRDSNEERFRVENWLLLGTVVVLPWLFAGVELWAYRAASLVLAVALAIHVLRTGRVPLARSVFLPAVLLALYAALQLVPLPDAVRKTLSPAAQMATEQSLPERRGNESFATAVERRALTGTAVTADRPPVLAIPATAAWDRARPISLNPPATAERLLWFFALLTALVLAIEHARDPRIGRLYRNAVFVAFTMLALAGVLHALGDRTTILWLREAPQRSQPIGPYVNPNHFGGAMVLLVPWIAATAWSRLRRRGPSRPPLTGEGVLLAGMTFICLVAVLVSASKASVLLIGFGLVLLTAFLPRCKSTQIKGVLVAMTTIAGVAAALATLPLGQRIRSFLEGGGVSLVERLEAWKAGLVVVSDHLWTGTGFGTFRDVFPAYLGPGDWGIWRQLHNDYLEVLLEGGLVGAVLLCWLIVAFWRRCLASLRGAAPEARAARIGLVVGLLCASLHAVVDFSLQIPANALLFVFASALALSEPNESSHGTRRPWLSWGIAAVVLSVFLVRAIGGVPAGIHLATARSKIATADYAGAVRDLEQAEVGFNRTEALWNRAMARINHAAQITRNEGDPKDARKQLELAAADYLRAADLVPTAAWPWAGLAEIYDRIELDERPARPLDLQLIMQEPWEAVGRPGRIALALIDNAIEIAPNDFRYHDQRALTLLGYGLREDALAAVRGSARVQPVYVYHNYRWNLAESTDVLQAFVDGSREMLGRDLIVTPRAHRISLAKLEYRLRHYDLAQDELVRAAESPGDVTQRAEIEFWSALTHEQLGRFEEASEHFRQAAGHPAFEYAAQSGLARVAEKMGDTERALALLSLARQSRPGDTRVLLEYVRVARKLEHWDKALTALREVLRKEPDRPRAHVQLVEILIAKGDRAGARQALERFEEQVGSENSDVESLRKRVR